MIMKSLHPNTPTLINTEHLVLNGREANSEIEINLIKKKTNCVLIIESIENKYFVKFKASQKH